MATLKIYQLKDSPENRVRRWMDYNGLGKLGETPQLQNYDKVYSMQLLDNPTPEQVVQQFNKSRPADFTGYPLRTSDIIVFHSEAETIALYANNADFVRLPQVEQELAVIKALSAAAQSYYMEHQQQPEIEDGEPEL